MEECTMEECTMDGKVVVVVSVLFCGSVIAARAFPGVETAREWARKVEGIGDVERDGPQFEVEYSM